MEFHNHEKTGNKGRKEPLQIHIGADDGDLSLLSTDTEQTVGPGTKGKMSQRGKEQVSECCVFYWPGLEEPRAARGREQWQGKPCLAGHS